MVVDAELDDCLCPSLDGWSEIFLVEKDKNGFFTGDRTDTKLASNTPVGNVCKSMCSVVWDVLAEEKIPTHVIDLHEVFDKNCFLNSCDNNCGRQCNVRVENECKYVMSVANNQHFWFLAYRFTSIVH